MLLGAVTALSVLFSAAVCWGSGAFCDLRWLYLLPACFAGGFLALALLAFLFLWLMCTLVDTSKPREKDSAFFRTLLKLYIPAIVKVVQVRLHTQGLEKTPKEGRFLLVCNHLSNADPVVLLHCFKDSQLAFISKRENATMFLVGKAMHMLLCQLVNRENDREALKTIVNCIQLIREDKASVAVFPEGYIHEDKKLHHFRHGVFKIATKTNVPIVVCTLRNTPQIFVNMPKLRGTDVELHLLDVIQPEQYANMTTVELGETIYRMMADDLGPELVSGEEA